MTAFVEAAASRIGRSASCIERLLKIATIPGAERILFEGGKVPMVSQATLLTLARAPNGARRTAVLAALQSGDEGALKAARRGHAGVATPRAAPEAAKQPLDDVLAADRAEAPSTGALHARVASSEGTSNVATDDEVAEDRPRNVARSPRSRAPTGLCAVLGRAVLDLESLLIVMHDITEKLVSLPAASLSAEEKAEHATLASLLDELSSALVGLRKRVVALGEAPSRGVVKGDHCPEDEEDNHENDQSSILASRRANPAESSSS